MRDNSSGYAREGSECLNQGDRQVLEGCPNTSNSKETSECSGDDHIAILRWYVRDEHALAACVKIIHGNHRDRFPVQDLVLPDLRIAHIQPLDDSIGYQTKKIGQDRNENSL